MFMLFMYDFLRNHAFAVLGEDMNREFGKYAYAVWKCLGVWEICKDSISQLILAILLVGAIMNVITLVLSVKLAFEIVRKPAKFRKYVS